MKILKLLSRSFLPIYIIIFLFFVNFLKAQEQPVDIWNLEKKSKTDNVSNAGTEIIEAESDSTFKIKSKLNNEFEILKDEYLQSNIIVVSGIYDPQENGLNIDMWSNSKGEKIKTLFNKISLINLSGTSVCIMVGLNGVIKLTSLFCKIFLQIFYKFCNYISSELCVYITFILTH